MNEFSTSRTDHVDAEQGPHAQHLQERCCCCYPRPRPPAAVMAALHHFIGQSSSTCICLLPCGPMQSIPGPAVKCICMQHSNPDQGPHAQRLEEWCRHSSAPSAAILPIQHIAPTLKSDASLEQLGCRHRGKILGSAEMHWLRLHWALQVSANTAAGSGASGAAAGGRKLFQQAGAPPTAPASTVRHSMHVTRFACMC